jgi:hypothetical protein
LLFDPLMVYHLISGLSDQGCHPHHVTSDIRKARPKGLAFSFMGSLRLIH